MKKIIFLFLFSLFLISCDEDEEVIFSGITERDEIGEAIGEIDNSDWLDNDVIKFLTVYPNPAYDKMNLRFTLSSDQWVKLVFLDFPGHVVEEVEMDHKLKSGYTNITVSISDLGLLPGIYRLEIHCSDDKITWTKSYGDIKIK